MDRKTFCEVLVREELCQFTHWASEQLSYCDDSVFGKYVHSEYLHVCYFKIVLI